jgi:putative hydrolase of the HAD superfamily
MKYEVILFDADETLFDFDKAEKYALKKSIESFEMSFKEDYHLNSYREVNNKIWEEFEKGLISADELKTERFRNFFVKLDLDLNPIKFSKQYLKFLSEASFLIEGTNEILSDLYQKYKLVLITNGLANVQRSRLKLSSLDKYFKEIIISEEIGIAKPDPEIFEYTFNKIKHKDKKKSIIIGDSLSSDIQGGINFGIDTCWFNPDNEENLSGLVPTYEINDLLELKEILEMKQAGGRR